MRTMRQPRRSLTQTVNAFDSKTVLQLLAHIDRKQAELSVLRGLLQARLTQLVSEPEPLLTVAEVAKRLSVSRGRVYELVRGRKLAKVTLGEKQVRIPDSAIRALSTHPLRTKADREAVL